MKHPHCNRSRAAHLFWCRGFAPVVFIFAIALIVVAIGSGAYFSLYDNAQAPSPQDVAAVITSELTGQATSSTNIPTVPTTSASTILQTGVPPKAVPSAMVNCGSDQGTVKQCLLERIKGCMPTKGIVEDVDTGLRVERIIDGYRGNECSYRTNIISGEGNFALLAGMDINCLLPKTALAATMSGGTMSQDNMFAYCTGSFMDLMREQMESSGRQFYP